MIVNAIKDIWLSYVQLQFDRVKWGNQDQFVFSFSSVAFTRFTPVQHRVEILGTELDIYAR